MLTRTEVERLAGMAHALRPDWPVKSLCTWLQATHATQAYRDVAMALAWVACDPTTRTPKRLDEMGPWCAATRTSGDAIDLRFERCRKPGHESFPATNCASCRSEALARPDDAPQHRTEPDRSETCARGRRAVDAAIAAAHHSRHARTDTP